MRFTRNQLWCVSAFSCAASLLLTGCFGGHSASRGIRLSDAMAASASGSSANLASNNSNRGSTRSHDNLLALSVTGETEPASAHASKADTSNHDEDPLISFAAEIVLPIASDIRSISRLELIPLAFQGDKDYAGFYIGGGDIEFRSNSFLDQAVTDCWMLDLGLLVRHYFTPPKTFLSPYVTGGVFGQVLVWDYRTPVNVNGEIIRSDYIFGGGGFVGLGFAVARKEHLGIFAEARLGVSYYDEATMRGFYNDVFEIYGYFSVRAGVSFKF